MPSEFETDIDCAEEDWNGIDVVIPEVVSVMEDCVRVVLVAVDPVWDHSTEEVEGDNVEVDWELSYFELDGANVIIVEKEDDDGDGEEKDNEEEKGEEDDDTGEEEAFKVASEDWEERGDGTRVEMEDAEGSAVPAGVLDDWMFWDDSIEDVEVEEIKELEKADRVVGTLEEATNESVWVALTCSEADTVEISVIFSVVEETTEFAKVIGYTLVVV